MKRLISFIFSVLIATSACAAESGQEKQKPSNSVFFLENICGTDSAYVLYPEMAWRSYVAKEYIHPTFDDLLSTVSKMAPNTKIVFGCFRGVNQFASSSEIKKRTAALEKACYTARIECVAQSGAAADDATRHR